jgi:5-hydroxyisourate hydrolase
MGYLSTHVLDIASGRPAGNVVIELRRMMQNCDWELVKRTTTNGDGRTDEPLLINEAFKPGTYLLSFHIGAYFRAVGVLSEEPPFLDVVPVRFTLAKADGHYHLPLLASPWSYTTYRGS